MDPRAGMDALVRRKIPISLTGLEPPIINPVAQRYTTELTRLCIILIYFLRFLTNQATYFTTDDLLIHR
jgi:hypothetical protein